jgi:hypothetical protein
MEGDAMPSDREEKIRRLAYELWEIEGRPEGRHHEHWERAARELEAEEGGSAEDAEIPAMPDDFPEPGRPMKMTASISLHLGCEPPGSGSCR